MAAAAAASHMSLFSISMTPLRAAGAKKFKSINKGRNTFTLSAQIGEAQVEEEKAQEVETKKPEVKQQTPLRPVERQINVNNKNMTREYGGQWLSSVTRHVRIYAAYIDPETWAMDQTQMDKLTLLLDTTNEFVWTTESCNKVYSYFQELVDHYAVSDIS